LSGVFFGRTFQEDIGETQKGWAVEKSTLAMADPVRR
jgi:hypothetical protein